MAIPECMRVLKLFFTLILVSATASPAVAGSAFALSCSKFFSSTPIDTIPGIFERLRLEQVPAQMGQIKALAKVLLAENYNSLGKGFEPRAFDIKDLVIESIDISSALRNRKSNGYLSFKVVLREPLTNGINIVQIRSNGRVAFISATYAFRTSMPVEKETAKYYKAVYHSDKGIQKVDQGEVLLASMPKNFQISRSMSEIERTRWINGEPFLSRYGQKVHFAPGYFKYDPNNLPFQTPVSRKQILEAYRRGEIEINIYDDHSAHKDSMWMGDVKLEFEIVFVGLEGVKTLRPILEDSLRQDIFPF